MVGASSLVALMACREAPARPDARTAVTRPLGTWQGRGSQTIGVVSDSGRLRIAWRTWNGSPAGDARFRLTLHSAVSGRPLHLIADERGTAQGTIEVTDDPRPYNFMVDSADVDWSFTVEEIIGVGASGR